MKSKYFCVVKLEPYEGEDLYKDKGPAEKVLVKAINYINKKDSDTNFLKALARYLKNDFDELETFLREFNIRPKKKETEQGE